METVDKLGIPVEIGGVVMNDKDFQCIMRILQELVRIQLMKENEDILFSNCLTCAYFEECGAMDMWSSFRKLAEITGVPITPFYSKTGMCLPTK